MDINEKQRNSIFQFLVQKERTVLSLVFLLFLIVPISNNYKTVLWDLVVDSIDKWVDTIRRFSSSTSISLYDLVVESIERFFSFVIDGFEFFKSLLTFDFGIIGEVGFILSFVYIMLLIVLIYFILGLVRNLRDKQNLLEFLTVRKLLFMTLIIPFPTNLTWLGALFLIILLFYWLIAHIRLELTALPEASKAVIISWKKVLIVVFSSLYLLMAVFDVNYNFKLLDFVKLAPNVIVFALILLIAIVIL
ncbi:MAG: hypothetical protein ACTSR2_14100, partial [Candidatus Hodarchaeales archaeon]